MKAYQLVEWQKPPEFRDVPVPEPGPGEVLLRVGGSGACHSDLHLMEWPEGTFDFELPFTIGHENAGWVEALGPGVEGLEVGEAVAVYGPWGCGRCRACRLGRENYCERAAEIGALGGGLGRDGGMAEYLLVPSARLLLPLGDLAPKDAAPLSDAALTPYHAVKRNLERLVPGSTCVVIGVGGLGHMAVQILRAVSATRIIAVDLDPAKLELARTLGADDVVPSDADASTAIRELTHGLGAAAVLDFVGAEPTIQLGAAVVRPEGEVTVVGLAGGAFQFRFGAMPWDAAITVPYWGSTIELMEVLDLARAGRIRSHVEHFALDQAPDVYQRLRDGKIEGRAVVVPAA
ncbi:MAG TPA: NAD(P)-dependent alcohol dehydrogenase [Gaiella sp.]|jgi:propanol-preferring alcohol dehydrogenase|nr:NAD(P)-dependent alcohol dehydrogenase [Gaiella sp.]